jgi:hypothetical protein
MFDIESVRHLITYIENNANIENNLDLKEGYYFLNEAYYYHGPFNTIKEAEIELERYMYYLENGE